MLVEMGDFSLDFLIFFRNTAMPNYNQVSNSGDGTRPTTDGGTDNIGAGEKLVTKRTEAGTEISSPAPKERMSGKRMDVESSRHDDSAAYNLREDLSSEPNREATPKPEEMPVNEPKG
jgi:hypothetical protein